MGKFLTGVELENAIMDIIHKAEKELLIVSPYIKLDTYFKNRFLTHLDKPNLQITLIFGKNEKNVKKSLSLEDLDFFKQFPNVSVVYVENLHAKYYGNESKGVTTSINLYDYSFKHNIEFGVYRESSFKDYVSDNFDTEIYNFCKELVKKYTAIYVKRPVFEKKFFGINSVYVESEVLLDQSKEFLRNKLDKTKLVTDYPEKTIKEIIPIKEEKIFENTDIVTEGKKGFCIRTGVQIPFNPEQPFCLEAFRSWNYWGDENFQEKYCHFSGELSGYKTSKAKPVLYKNWKKAKQFLEEV